MNRRIFALVAGGVAAMALAGAQPAMADQCTSKCDTDFSTCNGSNPDTSVCLPKWGQCKRTCAGPIKAAPAKTVAVTTPAAKVTKVADTKKAAPAKTTTKTVAKAGGK